MTRLRCLALGLCWSCGCGGNVFVDASGSGGAPSMSSGGVGGVPSTTIVGPSSVVTSTAADPATTSVSASSSQSSSSVVASSSSVSSSSSSASSSSASSSSVTVSVASSSSGAGGSGGCGSLSNCNGSCVDTSSDPAHCGSCTGVCSATETCVNGMCAGTTCCASDDQNGGFPFDNNCSGTLWILWEYDPSCDISIQHLDFHTDVTNVAILADDADKPGATLFTGTLSAPQGGLAGIDVSPPVSASAGKRYWIGRHRGKCSIVQGGSLQQRYYAASSLAGPWDGPYQDDSYFVDIRATCP